MKILVLNCGSSSIKYKLYDMNNDQVLASGGVERIGLDNAFIKVALPNGEKKQIMHDMPDHKEGVNFVFQVLLDKEIGALQSVNEIDAVGRKRGSGMGGGHDEREQTLNQIWWRWTVLMAKRMLLFWQQPTARMFWTQLCFDLDDLTDV